MYSIKSRVEEPESQLQHSLCLLNSSQKGKGSLEGYNICPVLWCRLYCYWFVAAGTFCVVLYLNQYILREVKFSTTGQTFVVISQMGQCYLIFPYRSSLNKVQIVLFCMLVRLLQ